jgi:hypothetical protein
MQLKTLQLAHLLKAHLHHDICCCCCCCYCHPYSLPLMTRVAALAHIQLDSNPCRRPRWLHARTRAAPTAPTARASRVASPPAPARAQEREATRSDSERLGAGIQSEQLRQGRLHPCGRGRDSFITASRPAHAGSVPAPPGPAGRAGIRPAGRLAA